MVDTQSIQKSRPEKSIAGHWLRGGQTVAHEFDMTWELVRKVSLGFILWGLLVANLVNNRAPGAEQTYMGQAILIWFYRIVGHPMPDHLTVKDAAGVDHVMSLDQFDATPYIHAAVADYQRLAVIGFIIWFLGCAAFVAFLSIWFVRNGEEKLEDHEIRGQRIASLSVALRTIYDYNCRELLKVNFETLKKLGLVETTTKRRRTPGRLVHAAALYLRTVASDLVGCVHDLKDAAGLFFTEWRAGAQGIPASVGAAGGALAVAPRPNRMPKAMWLVTRAATAAGALLRDRYDDRFGSMRSMRYFESMHPGSKSDFEAYMRHDPAALYTVLRSDDWKFQRQVSFSQKVVAAAADLAREQALPFYRKPSDYLAPSIIGIPYPMGAEAEHTLIVGGSGSGKTVALHTLIDSLKRRGDKAIIYDPSGDFIKFHYRAGHDHILNPFDQRSVRWSPFNDMTNMIDWQAAAEDLFSDDSKEPYWTLVPRAIYARAGHLMTLFWAKYFHRQPTIKEFLDLINGSHNLLYSLLANTAAGRSLGETVGGRTESLRSVIANMTTMLEHLAQDDATFSIKRWVNDPDENNLLFITAPEDMAASVKPLLSHWASMATTTLLARNDEQAKIATWIIIDEFPTLKIDQLAKAPAQLRKFNGRMVIGIQQFSQLQKNYGKEDADTIVGLMANKLILKVSDNATKDYFSKLIGEREVRRKDESHSYGANTIRDGVSIQNKDSVERIVMPEELSQLPKFHGYLTFSPGRDAQAFPFVPVRYEPIDRPKLAEGCIRIVREESIDSYLPKVTEQMRVDAMIRNGGKEDILSGIQPSAGTVVYDESGPGVADTGRREEDRMREPYPGDTPDALPAERAAMETAHTGIHGLDRTTKADWAKVDSHLAREATLEEAISHMDPLEAFSTRMMGYDQVVHESANRNEPGRAGGADIDRSDPEPEL